MPGKVRKITPALVRRIARYRAGGLSKAETAKLIGVTPLTIDNWCKKHPQIAEAVARPETFHKRPETVNDPPVGRSTPYDALVNEKASNMALLGMTNPQIAAALEIDESTFDRWMVAHSEFRGAIQAGRLDSDGKVVRSLYQRANGFDYDESKSVIENGELTKVEKTTKRSLPDVNAQKLWLYNRHPDYWRDRREYTHHGETVHHVISGEPVSEEEWIEGNEEEGEQNEG